MSTRSAGRLLAPDAAVAVSKNSEWPLTVIALGPPAKEGLTGDVWKVPPAVPSVLQIAAPELSAVATKYVWLPRFVNTLGNEPFGEPAVLPGKMSISSEALSVVAS